MRSDASRLMRHIWKRASDSFLGGAFELVSDLCFFVSALDGGPPGRQVQRLARLWDEPPEAARSAWSSTVAGASKIGAKPGASGAVGPGASGRRRPSDIPPDELEAVLEAHDFRPKAAAAALGISRTTLYNKMRRFGM